MSLDDVFRLNLIERTCEECGATFKARPDRAGRFCRRAHATAYRNRLRGSGLPSSEVARRNNRFKNYGLKHEDFEQMWSRQNGQCAICRRQMLVGGRNSNSCHVDHDHASGVVRGLLCLSCNHGIGKFYDDPLLLERAASYLNRKVEE